MVGRRRKPRAAWGSMENPSSSGPGWVIRSVAMCRSAGPDLLPGPRPGSRRFRHIMSSQIFVTFRRRLAALCRKTPLTRTTGQVRCSPAVGKIFIIADTGGSVFAVEGSATLSRALMLALRVCLYACGGLAAALVFAVLLAGRASADQNPASAQNPGSAQTPDSATSASTSGRTAGLSAGNVTSVAGSVAGAAQSLLPGPGSTPAPGSGSQGPSSAGQPRAPQPSAQPASAGQPSSAGQSGPASQAPAASAASSSAAPAASVPPQAAPGPSGAANQAPAPATSAPAAAVSGVTQDILPGGSGGSSTVPAGRRCADQRQPHGPERHAERGPLSAGPVRRIAAPEPVGPGGPFCGCGQRGAGGHEHRYRDGHEYRHRDGGPYRGPHGLQHGRWPSEQHAARPRRRSHRRVRR